MKTKHTDYHLNKEGVGDHFKIAQFIARESISRMTGAGVSECRKNKPSSRFFVGTLFGLRSVDEDEREEIDVSSDDLESDENSKESLRQDTGEKEDTDDTSILMGARRVNPQMCGLRIRLKKLEGRLPIGIKFSIWGRVLPSIDQFRELNPDGPVRKKAKEFPQRWIRMGYVEVDSFLNLNDPNISTTGLNEEIEKKISDIVAGFNTRLDPFRISQMEHEIPIDSEGYAKWVESLEGERMANRWDIKVEVKKRDIVDSPSDEGKITLDITLVNKTMIQKNERDFFESSIFEPRLRIDTRGHEKIFCRMKPKNIRVADPRNEPEDALAGGLACVAEEIVDGENMTGIVETVAAPVYSQPFLDHTPYEFAKISKSLEDPFGVSKSLLDEMERFDREEWGKVLKEESEAGSEDHITHFEADRDLFHEEMERIERTTRMLDPFKGNDTVKRAFRMMMETIEEMNRVRRMSGSSRFIMNEWRPFQLGFILATIPDIVERRENCLMQNSDFRAKADLIWFPTGGGKTEAFQALGIFTAFHDRLNGKLDGVSVWLNFALRALTVQQTQRLFEIVYHANTVFHRNEVPGDDFRIGFVVGSGYTPNEIKPDHRCKESERNKSERIISEEIARNSKKYVYTPHCPVCGKDSIINKWDNDRWNITFRCSNPDCTIHDDDLPVSVVDDDIRRFPPAFIVGTIDKIATAGLSRKFHSLLRTPVYRCPLHGFVVPIRNGRRKGQCGQYYPDSCKEKVVEIQKTDSGPSLMIIDEVHLLEEELGAFTAHYESLLGEIQESGGFPRPKIVLASATMTDAADREPYKDTHVWHLTGLIPRRFPSPPPTRSQSFYYRIEEEETQRFFIGIHPHGKTENDAVIHTLRIVHSIIQDLRSGMICTLLGRYLSEDDISRLLRPYETTIDYVLALRQADGIKHSIELQLRRYMEDENREPVVCGEIISSRMNAEELSKVLHDLDGDIPISDENRVDTIPTSSSIAYGVDIRNINTMIMVGQPRRTSEDIQVTSRTGRRKGMVGLVFRLYHPVRQRDLTHYLLFHNYHINQDLLVDSIPMNRYQVKSVSRTMPGILLGLLYNHPLDRSGDLNIFKPLEARTILIRDGEIESLLGQVRRIYMTGTGSTEVFDREVDRIFEANIRRIINNNRADVESGIQGLFQEEPMTSLRDVDPGIPIFPNIRSMNQGLLSDSRLGRGDMTRTRIQVLYSHCPDSTFEYQGGNTIVKSASIQPDYDQSDMQNIHRLALALHVYPIVRDSSWFKTSIRGADRIKSLSSEIVPVRPGAVFVDFFPRVLQCNNKNCQHVWSIDTRMDDLSCPRCRRIGNKTQGKGIQIRHMAVHDCGNVESLYIPSCPEHGRSFIRLDMTPQEVSRWKWQCLEDNHRRYMGGVMNQRCRACCGGGN
jgi:hypothetical protein